MNSMLIQTVDANWQKVRTTNSTDASLPTRAAQVAKPSGIGDSVAQATASAIVVDATAGVAKPAGGGGVQNGLIISPYGVGSDTNTMLVAVYGWNFLPGKGVADKDLWVPILLGAWTCTLSSALPGIDTGGTARAVGSTELFCTTIVVTGTSGNPGVDQDTISPGGGLPASITVDLKGSQIVEIVFGRNSSSTSCNALVRPL